MALHPYSPDWPQQFAAIWENQPPILNTGELFAITEHPRYKLEVGAPETDNLARIYAQKWVDFFRQLWEAFVLLRQTDLLPREKAANTFFRGRSCALSQRKK
ncbi:MAG: hypothetical protein D6722_28095 [Bacteroidetes bacterium]|nr:MAG: hypothetical protein D6722_28095 [Bacteroidota bacterium]